MSKKPKDRIRGAYYYQGNCTICSRLITGCSEGSEGSRKKAKKDFKRRLGQHHQDFHKAREVIVGTQRRYK